MTGRLSRQNRNRLKLGLFGYNCSSGRAMTTAPERWMADWDSCLAVAELADSAGLDFLLPIARWKGYGGDTDYQGSVLETITWACGQLARTKHINVFATVHAPLVHPVFAAKQFVTADHIGGGRFGLNVVIGWHEAEFQMFGIERNDHVSRYEYGQEWIDVVIRAWGDEETFDFEGQYLKLLGVSLKPKPFGRTRPILMNAGVSDAGQAFALRNCDALFTETRLATLEAAAQSVANLKFQANALGRSIAVFTVGEIVCRPARFEAETFY